MIKVSTKGRYGLRAMLEIAKHYNKGYVLLRDIARRQKISEKYLSHIIPQLRVRGLIKASRGAHGGYTLARAPEDITLKEIIEALEGPVVLVECVGSPDVCDMSGECVARVVWEKLSSSISCELESMTLADLLKKEKENENKK